MFGLHLFLVWRLCSCSAGCGTLCFQKAPRRHHHLILTTKKVSRYHILNVDAAALVHRGPFTTQPSFDQFGSAVRRRICNLEKLISKLILSSSRSASTSITFRHDVFIHRFLEVQFLDFHCHNFLCWHRSYWDTFLFDFTWTLDIQRSDSAHCNRYALAQNDMSNSIHCTRKVHDFHLPTIDTTTTCCYHGCRDYRHRSTY